MPLIFFTLANGGQYEADAVVGETVLQAAQQHHIDAFVAECGGNCGCGTCHCYLDTTQTDWLAPAGALETEMLGYVVDERRPNSRLACQIRVEAHMEGLHLHVPKRQI